MFEKIKVKLQKRKNNNHGFTLFEVLISLSVLAILASQSTVVFMQKQRSKGAEKTAQEINMIQAAAKSYYMDNYVATGSFPNSLSTLKSSGYLSNNFPDKSPFEDNYDVSNSGHILTIRTTLPTPELAQQVASLIPGGAVVGSDVVAEINEPGSAPSLENLLHRDAISTDEQRTMHANVILDTNSNVRIVDENEPNRYYIDLNDDTNLNKLNTEGDTSLGSDTVVVDSANKKVNIDGDTTFNGYIRGNQNGAVRVDTGNGFVDIGPQNTNWAHFMTDRPKFYFNQPISINHGIVSSYNGDLQLQTNSVTRMIISETTGDTIVKNNLIMDSQYPSIDFNTTASIKLNNNNDLEFSGSSLKAPVNNGWQGGGYNFGRINNNDYLNQGLIQQAVIVPDGAGIYKPNCRNGSPAIFVAPTTVQTSSGKAIIGYRASAINYSNYWRIQIVTKDADNNIASDSANRALVIVKCL